jgi:hypothetical protein
MVQAYALEYEVSFRCNTYFFLFHFLFHFWKCARSDQKRIGHVKIKNWQMICANAKRPGALDSKTFESSVPGRLNVLHILEDAQKQLLLMNSRAQHSQEEKVRMREMTQYNKVLETCIKALNKWQRERASLSGKHKPSALERERLVEVERHVRVNQESIRQLKGMQGVLGIALATTHGALSEERQLTLASHRKHSRDLNNNVHRVVKLQNDLYVLNAKAIAKAGLTEAEQARRVVLRENHEVLAAEIRASDRIQTETLIDTTKRKADEQASKEKRTVQLWTDLAEYMRRRNVSAKRMYRQFDVGHRNVLSYWAFYKSIQSIGVAFDENDTDLLLSDLDTKGTGFIRYDAFRARLKERDPEVQREETETEKERKKKVAQKEKASSLFGLTMFGGDGRDVDGEPQNNNSSHEINYDDDGDDDDDSDDGANSVASEEYAVTSILEAGTPVMAMHAHEEGFFRATVSKDNFDGTCDIQFALAELGCDQSKPRNLLRILSDEEEVRTMWVEVSRAVGRHGAADLRQHGDFAGKLSHDALMGWLEETHNLHTLSDHTKHVLLAEVDPLHSGVISVSRFLDKLENFRERAKILGLGIFHRHDKEIASDEQEAATAASEEESGDDNGKDRDRCTPADASSRLAKPSNIKSSNTTAPAVPGVVLALESVHSQSRMVELEALIFTMAKRQQELALALSASEVHSCPLIYPVV